MRTTIRLEQQEDEDTTREWKKEIEESKKSKEPGKEKATKIPPPDRPERNQDLQQLV